MGQITVELDPAGIATLTIALEGKVNIMNDEFMALMPTALDRLERHYGAAELTGVVVTSDKRTFVAGGDLALMARSRPGMEAEILAHFERLKSFLRRLEGLGVPVVAAINGTALGGGYELCLACHHRIAVAREDAQLGLPEVDFGILPAAGGVIRLTALLGLQRALPFLVGGERVTLRAALGRGLVDALVADEAALLPAARDWIRANPAPVQPFDRRPAVYGVHHLPPGQRLQLQMASAWTRALGDPENPATRRIADVAVQSLFLPWDIASRLETRGFVELLMTADAQRRIAQFFNARKAS